MTLRNSRDTFECFNDGLCRFHLIDDDGNAGEVKEKMRFQERTVGVKRFYEAKTVKLQVDRLIRVPFAPWISTEYLAVIDGNVYEIYQTQIIPDTNPKTCDVTLHITKQRRVADGTV